MIILKRQCKKKNQAKDFATPCQAGLGEIFYRNWSSSPWGPVSLGTEDMSLKELATSSRKIKNRPWTLSGFMLILSLTFSDLRLSSLFPIRAHSCLVFSRLSGKPERKVVSSTVCFQLFKYPEARSTKGLDPF